MKKLLAFIVPFILILAGAWYVASPWLAMNSLAEAARNGDTAALEDKVDFPALRASASDQVSEATRRRVGQGGMLDGIGGAVAERLGREVANRALTPENVGTLVASGALASGFLPERLRGQSIEWDVEREGLDSFRAIGTFEDGTGGPTLLFARDGLGWKLTGFELP